MEDGSRTPNAQPTHSVSSGPGRRQHTWEHVSPECLEEWRNKTGMSSKEAAAYLKISLSCYYNWIRGQNVPTPARQLELKQLIDLTNSVDRTNDARVGGCVNSQAPGSAIVVDTRLSLADRVTAVFQSYVAAQPDALKPADVPVFLREVRAALVD